MFVFLTGEELQCLIVDQFHHQPIEHPWQSCDLIEWLGIGILFGYQESHRRLRLLCWNLLCWSHVW